MQSLAVANIAADVVLCDFASQLGDHLAQTDTHIDTTHTY